MSSIKNLWENLFDVEQQNTPFEILKEQAKYLQESTQGKIIGEITSRREFAIEFLTPLPSSSKFDDLNKMVYRFILSPRYNNYHYELLKVVQDIRHIYPVQVVFDSNIYEISNEKELTFTLKEIFSNNLTKNVVRVMLEQYVSV